jgi:hypothetical protein
MASLLVSRVFGISIPVSAGDTSEAVLVERGKGGIMENFSKTVSIS